MAGISQPSDGLVNIAGHGPLRVVGSVLEIRTPAKRVPIVSPVHARFILRPLPLLELPGEQAGPWELNAVGIKLVLIPAIN